MSTLSSNRTARGYMVRESPRGPLIGYVATVAYRLWQATCSICAGAVRADRRQVAAAGLARHYHAQHKETRR